MGAQQSSIDNFVRNQITTSVTNEKLTNITSSVDVSVEIRSNVIVKIILEEDANIGDIDISNQAKVNMKMIQDLEGAIDEEISNDIAQGVANDVSNTLTATTGAFAVNLSEGQKNNVNTTILNEMNTQIKNLVTVDKLNSMVASVQLVNNTTFELTLGKRAQGKNITINADVQFDMVANQIVSDVITGIMKSKSVQELDNGIISEIESHIAGLDDVIEAVGNVLSGLLKGLLMPMIVGVVGILVVVIIVVVLKNAKKKPEPPAAPPAAAPPPPVAAA